jgi:hypothetical protein
MVMAHVPSGLVSSEAAWSDLQRIFGLPDNCCAVTIRLRVNSPVMVACAFASPVDGRLATKRYTLVEREDRATYTSLEARLTAEANEQHKETTRLCADLLARTLRKIDDIPFWLGR